MAKYVYPAIFTPEEDGGYSVDFPDIEGCFTCGETLASAMAYAEDVLALMLLDREERGEPIPSPGDILTIPHESGAFVSLIAADTLAYRKKISQKAVKKTLTIPEWLNTMAEEANVNFSQTLQDALMKKLHVSA